MKSCPLSLRLLLLTLLTSFLAHAEPLSFRRVIEMAVAHSAEMGGSFADQSRAHDAYREARSAFIPMVTAGSGLAATFGFPLSIEGSAPSVVSVNSQSFLLNSAQRDFIKATRQEWLAAIAQTADRRSQVVLEAAITYVQLDALSTRLRILRQQQDAVDKAKFIVTQRVQEGVDSHLELTKANLDSARVRMKIVESQTAVDVLRERLAQLTGIPASSIETSTESIPKLPEVRQEDNLIPRALDSSAALKAADQRVTAQLFRASGEHKQLRPAADLVGQYGLFARYNNYDQYFRKFQQHNGTIGLAIRIPFLNFAQRAHADAADAEVVKAKRDAETVKNQVSSETLKLQRTVAQLAAAKEVARLEYEVAQANFDAMQARVESGTVTLRDQQTAQADASDRYAAYLDAGFELDKTQLQLLRATGELENWAEGK